MLSWSPGLRKAIALGDERDDEAIAADQTPAPEETMIATITADDLSALTSRAMLGEFHRFVAENCADPHTAAADVAAYLEWVRSLPKAGRGLVTIKGAFDGRRRAIETREAA